MRSQRLSILVPCLLIAIVLVFIFLHPHHQHERVADETPPPPTVAVVAAHVGTIANQLSVAGVFQPFQDVDVHGKVSCYIRHIYVDIGDRVHEGRTLAVLEVPDLDAEVAGAQARITQTQQNIKRLQKEVAREEANYAATHANYVRLKQGLRSFLSSVCQLRLSQFGNQSAQSGATRTREFLLDVIRETRNLGRAPGCGPRERCRQAFRGLRHPSGRNDSFDVSGSLPGESIGAALVEWISCGGGRADAYTGPFQQSCDRYTCTLRGGPKIRVIESTPSSRHLCFHGAMRMNSRSMRV
jgi:hypothetical protein